MQRREFIKLAAAMGVTSGFSRPIFAAESRPSLPIPPLLSPNADGEFNLAVQSGKSQFIAGKSTDTWGYNGVLLGPALRLARGKKAIVNIHNHLNADTTVHWHGLEIAGNVDGGPQAVIAPDQRRRVEFDVNQRAATCWFHPHPHQTTGYQVAMGLGGLAIIEDEESQVLPLPKQWGMDDIPLILQDKRLNEQGQIDYQLGIMEAAVGWFGETMLTNGTVYPKHVAPKGWLRLRLLNGCNARSLNVATSDNRLMYVVASDGGFLPEPVAVDQLSILMGERFEVLIDVSDGKAFDLVTLPVLQMGMGFPPFDQPLPLLRIETTLTAGNGTLPDNLIALPPLPSTENLPTRRLQLAMNPMVDMQGMALLVQKYGSHGVPNMPNMSHGMNHHGMHHGQMHQSDHHDGKFDLFHANTINGQPFHMDKALFDVKRGQYEKWIISGEGDMMLHPFHIHGTQFRILKENNKPVARHRQGWKDTVRVYGGISEVLVKFDHLADAAHPYMAHCHLLEHEDTGMMMSFTVSA